MKKPIRILHVFGRLDRGGAETMVMNLYRHIDRSKIQFDFVVHTNDECEFSDEIYQLGGKIFSIPRYTGKNHLAYKKEWKKLFESHSSYKIIHGHMRSTASIYLRLAKHYGLTTIAHSHSTASRGNKFERFVKDTLQRPIRFIADHMFACSQDAGKWLFGKNILFKRNFYIIKNAIETEKFSFNKTVRNRLREEYNIENKFVLGHVGNFTPPKNHFFLLDIFHEVQKKRKNSVLILVGDGELKEQIHSKALKLGISDKVILVGSKTNVNDYLQAMDIFLFPSLFEGLGIAVIEAQAAGLPCIISDRIPIDVNITELVYRLPLRSPKIWADTVLSVKCKRKNHNNEILKNGYDIKRQVKSIQELYMKML